MKLSLLLALALAFVTSCAALRYPPAQRGPAVDDYHGTRVTDPYRWLESLDAPETRAFIEAQNRLSRGFVEGPAREALRARLRVLWNYARVGTPQLLGDGRLFYGHNSGLEKQSPVYTRDSVDGPARVVLDPNRLWPSGDTALASWRASPDGRLLAYAAAQGGADWQDLYVLDLATGKALPDVVRWARFTGIQWTLDSAGFFYARYPEPPKGKTLSASLGLHELRYHRLGTPQADDPLIFRREGSLGWSTGGQVSEDGRYLFVYHQEGTSPHNRLHVLDLGDPRKPDVSRPLRPLFTEDTAELSVVGVVGDVVYARTDLGAPRRKVVAIRLDDPSPASWKTVIPEAENALEDLVLVGGKLYCQYLVDVKSEVAQYSLAGERERTLPLPGIGAIHWLTGRTDGGDLFLAYSSPTSPTGAYRWRAAAATLSPFAVPTAAFDGSRYETRQVFYKSRDGTRIPMFVTSRKDLPRDGRNPVWLYGYGGFSVSELPYFSVGRIAWLELGGVWAAPALRGGAEYGERWHEAGMLQRKQNVFDDLIAAAQHLIDEKVTSPARIVVNGGSNGGLLVGAVMTQRPELFGVALPEVGVLDMLRYDRFTGGGQWTVEYGASKVGEQFKFLHAYSPLHRVREGACYPATLITTADHDDRVVPSHSYKFTAALQRAQGCPNPVLLRVEVKGSHGYRPTDRRIDELADSMAFVMGRLGLTAPATWK